MWFVQPIGCNVESMVKPNHTLPVRKKHLNTFKFRCTKLCSLYRSSGASDVLVESPEKADSPVKEVVPKKTLPKTSKSPSRSANSFNAGMISSLIPLDRIKADDVQHSFAGHTFHDGESCIHTLMLQLTD